MDFSDPKKAFEHITKPAQLKPVKENWLILYQGKPIQLDNGKFRWNKKHHALCALTRAWEDAFRHTHPYYGVNSIPGKMQEQWLADFKLWREKNIKFVRQQEYDK